MAGSVFIVVLPVVALLLLSAWIAPRRRDPALDRDWAGAEGQYDEGEPFRVRLPRLRDVEDERPPDY